MRYLFALFLFVSPAMAQNCSSITGVLSSTARDVSAAGTVLKQINTYRVICTNTQNGAAYLNVTMDVEAFGGEGPDGTGSMRKCNAGPFETHAFLAAVGGTDSNSFTATGYNQGYASQTKCYQKGYQTKTTYCVSKSCTSKSSCSSPIVLDVDGQGYWLTDAAGGVTFDIGDGKPKQMGWTSMDSSNAFLALPGADGLVHSGQQLFGNFTAQPVTDRPNGFLALSVYDLPVNGGNGDGVIDGNDGVFSLLRLWVDQNHNGISEPSELHTLPELGVSTISLKYHQSGYTDRFGNVFRYQGTVNGNRKAFDIFFVTDMPVARKSRGVHLLMVALTSGGSCL